MTPVPGGFRNGQPELGDIPQANEEFPQGPPLAQILHGDAGPEFFPQGEVRVHFLWS